MSGLSGQEALIVLRKRARRRLVGAATLTLVSIIVLWNVVDTRSQREIHPESIELTTGAQPSAGEAEPSVAAPLPPLVAAPSAPLAESPAINAPLVESTPTPSVSSPPTVSTVAPPTVMTPPANVRSHQPEIRRPEKSRQEINEPDPAAILNGTADITPPPVASKPVKNVRWVVQLAALTDASHAQALTQKLNAAGISAHISTVQTAKGHVRRVRVGPFATQNEAQAVLAKMKQAGIDGGIVVTQ